MIDKPRYMGVVTTPDEFTKAADSELKKKCRKACGSTINQAFFDADLLNNALCTLYRTNIRSILMYGLMLTKDIEAMKKLDRGLLSMYFKPIVHYKRNISDRLIDRLCLRIMLPSLAMELETSIKCWLSKLKKQCEHGYQPKGQTPRTRYTGCNFQTKP